MEKSIICQKLKLNNKATLKKFMTIEKEKAVRCLWHRSMDGFSRLLIRRGTYRKRINLGKIFIMDDIAGNRLVGGRQWTEKCMSMNP